MHKLDADAEWVRAAYAAHGRELYRFALGALGDAGLAEDAVQTAYLRAWRASARFDEELGSLRTWLFAIIRNVVIDVERARRARPATTVAELGDGPTGPAGGPATPQSLAAVAEEQIDQRLLAWQVAEALGRLTEDHRRVLVETYYRGRPYEAVAADLGVPVGTVKSRVYYALRNLRLALEELGWSDDG